MKYILYSILYLATEMVIVLLPFYSGTRLHRLSEFFRVRANLASYEESE